MGPAKKRARRVSNFMIFVSLWPLPLSFFVLCTNVLDFYEMVDAIQAQSIIASSIHSEYPHLAVAAAALCHTLEQLFSIVMSVKKFRCHWGHSFFLVHWIHIFLNSFVHSVNA